MEMSAEPDWAPQNHQYSGTSGKPIPQVTRDLFRAVDANESNALEYGELAEWWNQQGGNPAELAKLEAAFDIAFGQVSVVDIGVFSHVMVAVATEGWTEERKESADCRCVR